MQKLLISFTCIASLILGGCSWSSKKEREEEGFKYSSSILERFPFAYRPDIQQGNIVTQEMVDQLEPGMSKRQVRFVMGTPMLVDVFHQDRWEYVYTLQEGRGDMTEKRLALFFAGDSLIRIEGDLRPQPGGAEKTLEEKETVVSVPDWDGSDRGIFTRIWDSGKSAYESVTSAGETDSGEQAATAPDSGSTKGETDGEAGAKTKEDGAVKPLN